MEMCLLSELGWADQLVVKNGFFHVLSEEDQENRKFLRRSKSWSNSSRSSSRSGSSNSNGSGGGRMLDAVAQLAFQERQRVDVEHTSPPSERIPTAELTFQSVLEIQEKPRIPGLQPPPKKPLLPRTPGLQIYASNS